MTPLLLQFEIFNERKLEFGLIGMSNEFVNCYYNVHIKQEK